MQHTDFVHLHVHTEYSLLDGGIKLHDLIEKAVMYKMPALAITDHGNMFGVIEFYKGCVKKGIKPIIGCEVYVAPTSRFEKKTHGIQDASFHLILLVKDKTGYRNLMKLVSIGNIEGFYYKPRIDKEILSTYSSGLIALSSCLKGEIPHLILKGELEQAKNVALEYRDMFGEGCFYLELHNHGLDDQMVVNQELIKMSKDLSIPLVATNDVHYINKDDAQSHDVLLCIQTGKTLEDKERIRFSTDEFYFKTPNEMKELFESDEAISNTVEIAKHCNLELDVGKVFLPHYEPPKGYTLDSYLRELCYCGLKERFEDIRDEIKERVEKELHIISSMGYSGYFLIIWDLINYAKSRGISVGPGRGSAAGSLVSYALGITDIDPIKYNLFFERFLNPERVSMPDIDIDFSDDRRDEVIDYVIQKYGKDRVARLITFGSMMAKGVIRDVGRVIGLSYSEVDQIAKLIPNESNISLREAISRVSELKSLMEDKKVKFLMEISLRLEGLIRHASTHAAGIVISKDELTNFTPLYKDQKQGTISTQYAMDSIADIGLLKMDLLGLKTLTVIEDTIEMIQRTHKIKIDISNIPLNDKKTFNMLSNGEAIGLFQLESSGMRDLLRKLKPREFSDLIALLALHRPGPLNSGMVDEFIRGKLKRGDIKYPHPALEDILKETYGVIVYQEQVMQIARDLAGFTLGQADELRRAMSKKIPEKMERMREEFIKGAIAKGVKEKVSDSIYELMAKFAEYGFNKAHSTCYALISYRTAYLKAHYPTCFMAALLTSGINDIDKIRLYVQECKRMGIQVLPPDINESEADFIVTGANTIRFGLAAVKNVGLQAINSIVTARKRLGRFSSLYEFCEWVDLRLVNKRVIESLIKCGAFDSTSKKRSCLMESVDHALDVAQTVQRDRVRGQTSFFDVFEKDKGFRSVYEKEIDIPEWEEFKLLSFEKEMLGLYITDHPLAKYEHKLKGYITHTTRQLKELKDGEHVVVGGIINSIKRITTRSEKRMAFINLEDLDGTIEVVVFPGVFEKIGDILLLDKMVIIKGWVNLEEDIAKLNAEDVIPLSQAKKILGNIGHIRLNTVGLQENTLIRLHDVLTKYVGRSTIYLHVPSSKYGEVTIVPDLNVSLSQRLINEVEEVIGKDSIWFDTT
ncbi:MAG: DNA polymerase III subunit alpha [bacterium]|nr:DNA polymerase III subunit alpha [bacterium]